MGISDLRGAFTKLGDRVSREVHAVQVDRCVIAGLLWREGYKSSILFPVSEYWAIVINGA